LPDPLEDGEFLALGDSLGPAVPELDPATRAHTQYGVLLNLRSAVGHTDDPSQQPFATNPLSLHSEGSGRALADQPRYIVLMCEDPGRDASAPRTVLVPMSGVAARLSADDLRLLSCTRYRDAPGAPTIVRPSADRYAFSMRDFQGAPLRWSCTLPGATEDGVNAALGRLLAAMYAGDGASAVKWTRGLLVVIDNARFFHGRTSGSTRPGPHPRHLKRLRIRQAVGGPGADGSLGGR
jgi:hypothetical protein